MILHLNGEPRAVPATITSITELMAHLELPARTVLVEHNGTALRPTEWDATAVQSGDQVEVVRIVAGG